MSKNGKAKLADGWVVIVWERSDLRAGIVELDESIFASTANCELRVPASENRRVRLPLPTENAREMGVCREFLRSLELRYG